MADINEVEALINNTVVPKSMQHIERMADPKWKQLWLDAAYKEMDGLYYETKMFDIVKDIPDGDKHHTVLPTMLLFKYKPPKSENEQMRRVSANVAASALVIDSIPAQACQLQHPECQRSE